MRFKHFFNEKQMSANEKRELLWLVDSCELIDSERRNLKSVIDSVDDKSVICIYDETGMCGFVSILDEDVDLLITELYVHPSSRHKGCGTALLKAVEGYAKTKGYDNVFLGVGYSNLGARKLYENNRYIYSKTGTSLATMKKYISKKSHYIGGVLYEVIKKHGIKNLKDNIEKIENFEIFYKYFKEKDDEKIKKCIKSETFQAAVLLVDELFAGRTLLADEILNGDYSNVSGTKYENVKNLKKAALGVNVYLDLKNQESVLEKIKEKEEKFKML